MEEKMDLRIQKTYLALRTAFVDLLEEKRFEDITVNELCDRAMIRRTTFYKHFADKYEYFTFYIRELVATFQDRLAPDVAEGEAREYLLHMSCEMIRFMKQHDKLVQNVKNSSMFPILLSIMLEQISLDVAQVIRRVTDTSVDRSCIEDIAAFYAGGLTNTLFRYLKHDKPIDEEQFISTMTEFLVKV